MLSWWSCIWMTIFYDHLFSVVDPNCFDFQGHIVFALTESSNHPMVHSYFVSHLMMSLLLDIPLYPTELKNGFDGGWNASAPEKKSEPPIGFNKPLIFGSNDSRLCKIFLLGISVKWITLSTAIGVAFRWGTTKPLPKTRSTKLIWI